MPRTPISDIDFYAFLSSRDSLDHQPTKYLRDRIVNTILDSNTFIRRNQGVHRASIHFTKCLFNTVVRLGHPMDTGEIFFEDCIFEEDFSSEHFDRTSLLGDCVFNKDCTLGRNAGTLKVNDLSVTGSLKINATGNALLEFKNINVGKRIIKQKVKLSASCDHADIEHIFCAEMIIRQLPHGINTIINLTCASLTLNGPWDSRKLKFERLNTRDILLQNISNSNNEIIISKNSIIGSLIIPLNEISKVDVHNSEVKQIILMGRNVKENSINIQNIHNIEVLNFNKVINEGSITLWNLTLEKGSQICIFSSDLGKTKFIKCQFSKAQFGFENSQVTEIFLSETDFPKVVLLKGNINHAQSQLAFGQLTTAFTKQGDTVRSLAYQAREIEAHYRDINWISLDVFKKISLWLNKWSNNFGRYWFWGLLFSFGVGTLFFFLLLFSSEDYHFSLKYNEDFFESFLKFMNPLRFFDAEALFKFRDHKSFLRLNGLSYFWDFLGRIFVAYGYYQTIQAFRRFGRSK